MIEPVTTCRVCQGVELKPLFSLGAQFVSDFVQLGKERAGPQVPIELVLCSGCGCVQQRYTAPQDFLYSRHYWYRSGSSQGNRDALREITAAIECRLDLKSGDVVLDLGSNDGELLRSYAMDDLVKVGVEPADNLQAEGANGLDLLVHGFWNVDQVFPSGRVSVKQCDGCFSSFPRPRIVTAIGMMYDSPDPSSFVADEAMVLRPDGMFVAQLMCLRQTLELGDIGNICHEHLLLFPLKCLIELYARHGLEVFDVEENAVNGGSYRIWARLKENTLPPKTKGCVQRTASALRWESGYGDLRTYEQFYRRAQLNREMCMDFVRQERAKGKSFWWYGSSTKSAVILQFYGLDAGTIEAATDRDVNKHGLVMVGSGIHISSLEEFRRAKPDYAILGPYSFLKEVVEQEREWLRNGGQFVLPLPSFKVVGL